MFGMFKKKEKEEKCFPYYKVNIDDAKTVAQLRECIKALMKCVGGPDTINFTIGKNKIEEYPHLAKIATKIGEDDE